MSSRCSAAGLSVLLLTSALLGCRRQPVAVPVVAGSPAMTVSEPIPAAYNRHPTWRDDHVLRVCADPNNMPFSNAKGEGFENHLATMVAHDVGARLEYQWWPERRGFVRNTLRYGSCDVVMGVPASYQLVLATVPYYRSTYVFVTRHDRHIPIASFDDPVLHHLRIGFHTMGDDYSNSPAETALARRGLVDNAVGITVYGDYSQPDPPADLLRAVADGQVDVAVAWGPLVGYYTRRSAVRFDVRPVTPQIDTPFLPFAFDISAGVRRGDTLTRAMLDREFTTHRAEIQSLLHAYGVPMVDASGTLVAEAGQ
jgi:mxaJ protein